MSDLCDLMNWDEKNPSNARVYHGATDELSLRAAGMELSYWHQLPQQIKYVSLTSSFFQRI